MDFQFEREKRKKNDSNLFNDKKFVNAFFSFVGLSCKFKADMTAIRFRTAGAKHRSQVTSHCFADTEGALNVCES